MKKYQWILGTLIFSPQHNAVGTIAENTDNDSHAILIGGETLPVEDPASCRYATEAEYLALEPVEEMVEEKAGENN